MIDGVVVHQRREMHELHHRGERHGARLRPAGGGAREQRERGAEHLPLHEQEMPVHLVDEREFRGDDPVQFLRDQLEAVAHRRLDVAQRRREGRARGEGRRHRDLRSVAASRSPMSRNWMSCANTRS